jgi:hypothetical protein
MPIQLDLDQWPFVFTKFDGSQSLVDLDEYVRRMSEVHGRKERYVGITYIKRYSRERAHTERMARWLKESGHETREFCLAAGMVNASTGFRFILSGLFLIKPMPCPYQVCATFDEALAFVRQQADKQGLALPAVRPPWDDLPR